MIDFVLRIECMETVNGRADHFTDDDTKKIYIAQAIPQWLFVIIFPLWCVNELKTTKANCRQFTARNTRPVDQSKRPSSVKRVIRHTRT